MDSPASTGSSSDLYLHSEPTNKDGQAHPVLNGLSPKQKSQPLLEDSTSEFVGSRRSSTPQTMNGDREDSLSGSRRGSTSVAAVPNGHFHNPYPKRKRDNDSVLSEYPLSRLLHMEKDYTGAQPSSVGSSSSLKRGLSNNDINASMDDWSGHKRSKTDENSSRPTTTFEYSPPSSVLPAELWQYICCFVPPVFLGRLLRVNRALNAYLTLERTNESHSRLSAHSIVKPMSAQSVWGASRKRFCPGLPKPLRGLQELEMWRLLRGRNCQICGENKVPRFYSNLESPWESGPGDKGVKVIWPFGIRCCGQCLQTSSEKVSPTIQITLENSRQL